jgi:hypothetical protein
MEQGGYEVMRIRMPNAPANTALLSALLPFAAACARTDVDTQDARAIAKEAYI